MVHLNTLKWYIVGERSTFAKRLWYRGNFRQWYTGIRVTCAHIGIPVQRVVLTVYLLLPPPHSPGEYTPPSPSLQDVEIGEGIAYHLTTSCALQHFSGTSGEVEEVRADLTPDEAKAAHVPEGMIQRLTFTIRIQRGTNGKQTSLLAEKLRALPSNPYPHHRASYPRGSPLGSRSSSRHRTALALGALSRHWHTLHSLTHASWQLAYLTHTAKHVYCRARWEELLLIPSRVYVLNAPPRLQLPAWIRPRRAGSEVGLVGSASIALQTK
ncbi:hypothetical protein NMY22_g218 [Coprinellus aureogranulatus]|nr:hypothetical protein NMY22_g218 [Coprinellus aureogranulatus]